MASASAGSSSTPSKWSTDRPQLKKNEYERERDCGCPYAEGQLEAWQLMLASTDAHASNLQRASILRSLLLSFKYVSAFNKRKELSAHDLIRKKKFMDRKIIFINEKRKKKWKRNQSHMCVVTFGEFRFLFFPFQMKMSPVKEEVNKKEN